MASLYRKIMVTLDGSEFAAEAVPHAREIASSAGAELIVFEVVPELEDYVIGTVEAVGVLSIGHTDEVQRRAMDDASSYLDDLAESLRHWKIDVEVATDTGDPATCIVDYAAANDVDLIVMSSHGRTGLARWAYGSVTHKVLQAAPCAVLVVRPAAL